MRDKAAIINTARKWVEKGQIDKAIAEWQKLLANSKDGNVHNTIGDLYLKKGSEKEAIESFTSAAEIFKKDGFYPKSIALYKKILNIMPNDVNALVSLAKLNADKGLVGSAIEYYFKAAEICHREGATEKASTVVDKIIQLSPADPEIRKNIAYLYFRLGLRERAANEYASIASGYLEENEYDKAEEMCNQSIGYDEKNTTAYTCLSKLAERSNNMDKAFEYMEKALSFEPDSTTLLLSYSTLLINNNRIEDAKSTLKKSIEAHPSDFRSKKMLGTIYLNEGRTDRAWEELLPYIDNALESEEWSAAHELLHNFKESFPIPVSQRLITICRSQGDEDNLLIAIKELASLHENESSFDMALKLYKETLELVPGDSESVDKIHELEVKLGIASPAEEITLDVTPPSEETPLQEQAPHEPATPQPEITHYEEVLSPPAEPAPEVTVNEVSPQEPAAAFTGNLAEKKSEADFYAEQGLPEEALVIYEELLSIDPDNEEIRNKVNSIKAPSPSREQASGPEIDEIAVKDTMAEKPAGAPSIDDDLKDIFTTFGKSEEGESTEDYEARYQAGLECRQKGLLDEAIKELRISAKDPEKKVRNSIMLALCYMEHGSHALAITEFTNVLESMSPSDSTYIHVKYELASACLNNKDPNRALELYSEIQAANPDFKDVPEKISALTAEARDKPKKDRVSYI